MFEFLKFKNFKGTWMEAPSIVIFSMSLMFIAFFIVSKMIYILNPILNYFTFIVSFIVVWHFIIGPMLDNFSNWFSED